MRRETARGPSHRRRAVALRAALALLFAAAMSSSCAPSQRRRDAGSGADDAATGACPAETPSTCEDRCVDLQSDTRHCGACNNACPEGLRGTIPRCVAGRCETPCREGFADCDRDPANGCEANLQSDPMRCGGCNTVCAAVANATPSCTRGVCIAQCAEGRGDCDGSYETGCETEASGDPNACGGCDTRCPWPARTVLGCINGGCTQACVPGYADCDRAVANGCEAAMVSARNCGACGMGCSGATPLCAMVSSTPRCVATCPDGTRDCEGACVQLDRDRDHCGACNNRCRDAANAQGACTAGRCALECRRGYGDCDGDAANGCETRLSFDTNHCGACGNVCPAGVRCANGRCGDMPPPRDAGVDAQPVDVVPIERDAAPPPDVVTERDTGAPLDASAIDAATDAATECMPGGTCTLPHANAMCNFSGTCVVVSCETGWLDCDMRASNGCELENGASCTLPDAPCHAGTLSCNTRFARATCTRGTQRPAGSACLAMGTCNAAGQCVCPTGAMPNTACSPEHVCNAMGQCMQNVLWRNVSCSTGPRTADQLCQSAGFARAVSADGWWWYQCTGPNHGISAGLDLCAQYSEDRLRCEAFCIPGTRSVDCTGSTSLCRSDARMLRERRGDGSTVFDATEFLPCSGINPGWSVRVQCVY